MNRLISDKKAQKQRRGGILFAEPPSLKEMVKIRLRSSILAFRYKFRRGINIKSGRISCIMLFPDAEREDFTNRNETKEFFCRCDRHVQILVIELSKRCELN